MPSKINMPVDGMFRAGMISGKEWARLNGKTQGWSQSHKMKSKMATFEHKVKDEAKVQGNLGNKAGNYAHIDRPDQGDSAKGAFTRPTKGGYVQGGGAEVTNKELDEPTRQKPDFPYGAKMKGKNSKKRLGAQQPGSSDRSAKSFTNGDGNRRQDRPSRLGSPNAKGTW